MQEKVLLQSNPTDLSEKEMRPIQSFHSRTDHQLTIEIPTPHDMVYMHPPTIHNQFSYHHPLYQSKQMDQNIMTFPIGTTLQNKITENSELDQETSPKRPEMYIVKGTEQSSDGESDRSSEEDITDNGRSRDSSMVLNISSDNTSSENSTPNKNCNSSRSEYSSPERLQSTKSGLRKKHRTNYTFRQVQVLERIFVENAYPNSAKMESLARELDIAQTRIKIWFQNKRARFRKHAQEKPQHAHVQMPFMSPMGPYGPVPFHHPMLHGSTAQIFPGPFFYPGQSFGMPGYGSCVSATPTGLQLPTTQTTANISSSPSLTSSPSTSDVSPNISDEWLNTPSDKKSEYSNMVSPYYHPNPPYIPPYTPFAYSYGMCPPL